MQRCDSQAVPTWLSQDATPKCMEGWKTHKSVAELHQTVPSRWKCQQSLIYSREAMNPMLLSTKEKVGKISIFFGPGTCPRSRSKAAGGRILGIHCCIPGIVVHSLCFPDFNHCSHIVCLAQWVILSSRLKRNSLQTILRSVKNPQSTKSSMSSLRPMMIVRIKTSKVRKI